MGDILKFTHHQLHKISIKNEVGTTVGSLIITGHFHNYEDGLARPLEPSGPANRKIVNELERVTIEEKLGPGSVLGSDPVWPKEEEKKQFHELVAHLKDHSGLKDKGGKVISPDDTEFSKSFQDFISARWKWKAEFQ